MAMRWGGWGRGLGRGFGLGMGMGPRIGLGLGRGFGIGAGLGRGRWPGAGPFSNLPPWQRPGWIFGRGMFNPNTGYGGAPMPMGYGYGQSPYMGPGMASYYPPFNPMPNMAIPSMQSPMMPPYNRFFNPYSMNPYMTTRRWW